MKEVVVLVDKIIGLVCLRGLLVDWDYGILFYVGFLFVRIFMVVNLVY